MTRAKLQILEDFYESSYKAETILHELQWIKNILEKYKIAFPETKDKINNILDKHIPLKTIESFVQEMSLLNEENNFQLHLNDQYNLWLVTDEGRASTYKQWLKSTMKTN